MKTRILFPVMMLVLALGSRTYAQEPPTSPEVKTPPAVTGVPLTVGTEKDRDTSPAPDRIQAAEVSSNELKLRQLAELVEDLKNKVTATKFRLQLLKEAMTVERGAVLGGARIEIRHLNRMGGAFRMIRLRYMMDGKLIASYSDAGEKDRETLAKKEISIPVGHVSPGNVRFRVFITYQGNGYGMFRYVREWKWDVHNTYSFNVEPGKQYILEVRGVEKGGWTTPLDQRPHIEFQLKSGALVVQDGDGESKGSK